MRPRLEDASAEPSRAPDIPSSARGWDCPPAIQATCAARPAFCTRTPAYHAPGRQVSTVRLLGGLPYGRTLRDSPDRRCRVVARHAGQPGQAPPGQAPIGSRVQAARTIRVALPYRTAIPAWSLRIVMGAAVRVAEFRLAPLQGPGVRRNGVPDPEAPLRQPNPAIRWASHPKAAGPCATGPWPGKIHPSRRCAMPCGGDRARG